MNNALLNVKREAFGMYLERKEVRERLKALLKENADSFTGSLLHIVSNNAQLKSSDPNSVIQAALLATWLNLPINNNWALPISCPTDRLRGSWPPFSWAIKAIYNSLYAAISSDTSRW